MCIRKLTRRAVSTIGFLQLLQTVLKLGRRQTEIDSCNHACHPQGIHSNAESAHLVILPEEQHSTDDPCQRICNLQNAQEWMQAVFKLYLLDDR